MWLCVDTVWSWESLVSVTNDARGARAQRTFLNNGPYTRQKFGAQILDQAYSSVDTTVEKDSKLFVPGV